MRCEQAQQLFDAYLDGELSPALGTELGAHRVNCAECRRALALMEVTGHIVASDSDPVRLSNNFSHRLQACMEAPSRVWKRRFRRGLYIGGPLAAAAVIALAFLGVFDPGGMVAGEKEVRSINTPLPLTDILVEDDFPTADDSRERLLDEWVVQARENLAAKRQSGESLQQMLDLTISQWLDILNEANETTTGSDALPGADRPAAIVSPGSPPAADKDVEDL